MTFFEQSVFFGVSVSLAAYGIGVLLQKKFKFALFNPLLISVVLTIAVLLTARPCASPCRFMKSYRF